MIRRAATGTGLLVAGAFLLMQLAWILTMPPATGIDEFDHIHRAASVSRGDWSYSHEGIAEKDGRGELVPVPRDVVAATNPGCESFRYTGRANCNAYAERSDGTVLVASAAARYNPFFYVLVGYPSSLFEGQTALLAMRLASAALSAGMLALGALAIQSWARTRWPLLGLFLAVTPTVVYSTSLAAPNGLHIVSGLTLWAALLGLVHGPEDDRTRRRLLATTAIASVTLVNTHSLGVVWLGLIVAAVLIQRGRRTLPRVPAAQRRIAWFTLAIVLVGAAGALAWVVAARTNEPAAEIGGTFTASWWPTVLVGVPLWPLQAIAAFPTRDEAAPLPVYAIGVSLMCIAAVIALRSLLRRREVAPVLAIGFVAAMSFAIPFALTAVSFKYIGLAWQGRYEMPFTGGLVLLFALALERSGLRLPRKVIVLVMGLIATMNLLGQLRIGEKFEGGEVALAVGWDRPSTVVLVGLCLGFTVLGAAAVSRGQNAPGRNGPAPGTRPLEAADPVPSPAR